jgi:nucleoside-diphosphate-sugar epimerase
MDSLRASTTVRCWCYAASCNRHFIFEIPTQHLIAPGSGHSPSRSSTDLQLAMKRQKWSTPYVRVLVTGAGGFIGSAAASELLGRGHEVACLLRRPSKAGLGLPWAGRAEVIPGDLAAPENWSSRLLAWRPDACVHAAWFTAPTRYLHSTENVWLLRAGLRLIDVLAGSGCRQAVFLGTCAEYDTSKPEALDEASQLGPSTLYASAKVALSLLGGQRARAAGLHFAWARIFHPYGPRENPQRVIPLASRAFSKGVAFTSTHPEARRDFVHVEDVAGALAALVESGADGPYNVSSGQPASVRQALEILAGVAGRPELLRFASRPRGDWDPDTIYGSGERLAAATGWRPSVGLVEGLASTFAWWSGRSWPGGGFA